MSEEPFIKEKFDWIDNLKVRFSIGQLGSQNGLGYGISYLNMVNLSQKPIFWEETLCTVIYQWEIFLILT